MSGITTLQYAMVNQARIIVAPVTSLELSGSSLTIGDVVKGVQDAGHPARLKVYRTSLQLDDEYKDNFQENVQMILKGRKPLGETTKLGDCNIGKEEILVVEVPWRDMLYCIVDQSHTIIAAKKSLQKIDARCTIEQLKEKLVEKEQSYHDIEPTSLDIYKSSLVATDELAQAVSALMKKTKPLEAANRLVECNIGKEEILVVGVPWRDVLYCIVDQSYTIIAPENYLTIDTGCTINQLKEKFVAKEQDYHNIQPASLNVYKSSLVATDNELEQNVSALMKKIKPLGAARRLRDCNIGKEEILLVELPWRDVLYCIVDQSHTIIAPENYLTIDTGCTINQLKEQFVAKEQDYHNIQPASLNVYKSSLVATDNELEQNVSALMKKIKPLGAARRLRDCNIGKEEILLVELPCVITLQYAVIDQTHRIVTPVTSLELSGSSLTIRHLVKRIKDAHGCADIARLKIYRTSLQLDDVHEDNFEENVRKILTETKPLGETTKLIDCNIEEEETLLVKLPGVMVWYRLANENNIFEGTAVKVFAVSVSDLRLRVKNQRPQELGHVDAAELTIWRYEPHFHTNTESKVIENIKDDANATALQDSINLRDLGLSDDDMLIVQFPNPSLDKPCRPGQGLSPSMLRLRQKHLGPKMTPSQMTCERLLELQREGGTSHFQCNRPITLAPTIPVTLLHPILNEFQHDCESYNPKTEDYRFAMALSQLSQFYSCESDRQEAFLKLCKLHNLDIQKSKAGSQYRTDGSIIRNGRPCLIVEIKNEIGSAGAEPVFQTAAYYRSYLAPADTKFTYPCIGMYVAGPLIGFFGMAFTTQVNVQMLGQTVRVDYHQTADSQWTILGRHLGALREAVKKLETLYASDTMTIPVKDANNLFFPAYHHFNGDNGENEVQYISQPMAEKLLFTGRWDRKDVMIKFVQRYSIQAHRSCAQRGSAPKLFGWQELKGGWTMVVMERLDESWKMLDTPNTKELFGRIRRVVDEMHDDNFVHGDVRDANIMIKEEGEEYRIKLVDFDWAGVIGQTVYPRNVGDCKQLRRPQGVCDGEEIKKEHDLMMLDFMFKEVVNCDSPWW